MRQRLFQLVKGAGVLCLFLVAAPAGGIWLALTAFGITHSELFHQDAAACGYFDAFVFLGSLVLSLIGAWLVTGKSPYDIIDWIIYGD